MTLAQVSHQMEITTSLNETIDIDVMDNGIAYLHIAEGCDEITILLDTAELTKLRDFLNSALTQSE